MTEKANSQNGLVAALSEAVLSREELLELQREQHRHDQRNHADIASLPKTDRLKHYGLHYAKYVGRLARGSDEAKSVERTLIDATLICLSAANALHQQLDRCSLNDSYPPPRRRDVGLRRRCGAFRGRL